MQNISEEALLKLVKQVTATRSDEIDCEECYEHLDRFVELKLEGKSAEQIMPLLQHHMEMCTCCQEEFEALAQAIEAAEANPPTAK